MEPPKLQRILPIAAGQMQWTPVICRKTAAKPKRAINQVAGLRRSEIGSRQFEATIEPGNPDRCAVARSVVAERSPVRLL
jgi:hypothetical protein